MMLPRISPCARRLSHTLLQSSLLNPLRHYSVDPPSSRRPGVTAYHQTTATQISPLDTQEARYQDKMKALIEEELRGATFHVDLTTEDGILYADPRTVKTVIKSLRTTFRALTSGGDSSATDPRFPEKKFSRESQSYEPLVHLLNKITDTANRYVTRSQLSELRFHRFGGQIEDTCSILKDLKPDGIGIIGKLSTKKEESANVPELSWEKIEFHIKSKASVREMVRQSATYARCCLLSNRRRFFSLGIGFNYKSLNAYIFVFHRSGLSSSRPLKVTTREGFDGLVRHIVGILSFKDEAAYGLDTTRTQDMFRINNRYYKNDRFLYDRRSLKGHTTVVYSLQATEDIPQHLESRMLTLSGALDHLPDKLTYKQTYQIKGYSKEGPILSQFNGQFGIANIIGYHECGPEDPHGSTRRLLNDAESWRVFEQQDLPEGRRHEPEERGLHCIALAGEARALIDTRDADGGIPSPGELLESILHAIIGHYNLFNRGILHRDISSGNVLRYSEPVWRPTLEKFECTRNVNHCRGFLSDADQAVKWREFSNSQSISGTIPFVSMRLLSAWQGRETVIHTALDDLESFLWLLIWGIVHASKDIKGATIANRGIQLMLDAWSGDVNSNRTKLSTAERDWKDAVFGDLIREWLDTSKRANQENERLTWQMSTMHLGSQKWDDACNELESYCNDIYKEVLESGFRHLEGVREYSDWDKVVAANVCRLVD